MTDDPSSRRPLLVFADDGADPADTAWSWISNQPWPGWHVDVLTAKTGEEGIDWGQPAHPEEWVSPWERPASAIEQVVDVRFLTVATDPRAMLADTEADLLVVGMRTSGFLEAMVTGSTAEWLLHHPPAPLLIALTPDPMRRVTICVDESPHALAALHAFLNLPGAAASSVSLVAVDDGRTDPQPALLEAASALDERVDDVATTRLEGKPTKAILDHLADNPTDLVVLGTRGLTGWQRLRLGSTASAVVRAAPCASLVHLSAPPSGEATR